MEKVKENFNIQRWVVIVAIFLFIIKIAAWYLTRSISVLTDALESTVNVVSGFVGLYSLYLSAQPRDDNHPYGHGKVEFLSAGLEGSLIFMAGSIIIVKVFDNLHNPREIGELEPGIILVSFAAVVNFVLGAIAIRKGKANQSLALVASGKHLQSDTITTVGILVGLFLIKITGKIWIDSVTAIIFALFIIYTGIQIVRESVSGIMDEADKALLSEMVVYLYKNKHENWIDLHNLRVIKYGSILHVDCHLTVPWYLNVYEAHAEVEALEKLVKGKYGKSVELFVHTDGCLDFSCKICRKSECRERKHEYVQSIEWTAENISTNQKHRLEDKRF